MRVPDRIYGYVTHWDRQDEPDKVALVLLLPTEKARQKGGRGVESRPKEWSIDPL
jgi:hypothetical protein